MATLVKENLYLFKKYPSLRKLMGLYPNHHQVKKIMKTQHILKLQTIVSILYFLLNIDHAHDEQKHEDEFEDSVAPLLNIDKYVNKKSPLYQHLITHTNSFHITGKIGKGGFGSVVRATHKLDNNEYAIKTIKLHLGLEQDVRNHKVLREVHTMTAVTNQNVRNQNILRVYRL